MHNHVKYTNFETSAFIMHMFHMLYIPASVKAKHSELLGPTQNQASTQHSICFHDKI